MPLGTVDPIFLGELALRLKMPVGELDRRMSAHELTVFWPAFFRDQAEEQRRQERERANEEAAKRRTFG